MSLLGSWRPLLRLAWRDALRARGRSVLVLVMVALPVLGVTVAATVIATQGISGAEALDRRLGAADAQVSVPARSGPVQQAPDPHDASSCGGARKGHEPLTLEQLDDVLGRDVDALAVQTDDKRVETDDGVAVVGVTLTDLTDPLTHGLVRLEQGRYPSGPDEAFVNSALAERGPGLGETLVLTDGTTLDVVGVGEDASTKSFPTAFAPIGAVDVRDSSTTWLVDAGGPVTWEQVKALNARGAEVLSRAVLQDPPSAGELYPDMGWSGQTSEELIAVAALVVTMALLEVVLLAGPAFAVTARRQARTLALMAATGGTPKQARRAILAVGLVLGTVGAVIGVGLGILLAGVAAVPIAQRFSGQWLGPFDVPWLQVGAIAGFGLLSAVLAAAVPAWIASRQDVVAVLAGRRGDRAPSLRSPLLGLVLLGVGVALAAYGTTPSGGELMIATAAVVVVLAMILLVPVVVVAVAKVSGRLPLPLRYAVRDAARHRTRTVPAVAAVAATVAGVVALGISATSDALEHEMTYSPQLPMGDGAVSPYRAGEEEMARIERVVRGAFPDGDVSTVEGVESGGREYTEMVYRAPNGSRRLLQSFGGTLSSSDLVAAEVPALVRGLDAEERARADAVLAEGGVVVFANRDLGADRVTVVGKHWPRRGRPERVFGPSQLPATYVQVGDLEASIQAILSPEAAERLGVTASTVAVHVTGTEISGAERADVSEAVAAVVRDAGLYVERGYRAPEEDALILWVLGALGAVLMLGGTLTATFLALSDARPDLATLAAVGAAPRTRRGVAAAYALVVGLVGAVLGAAVGFVPGVAITYPLTGESWASTAADGSPLPDHYLGIPWLMIGVIVVGLPLLTAAVVGLCARSRLPLVARVD